MALVRFRLGPESASAPRALVGLYELREGGRGIGVAALLFGEPAPVNRSADEHGKHAQDDTDD